MIEPNHDGYEEFLEPLLEDSLIQTDVEDNNSDPNALVQKKF